MNEAPSTEGLSIDRLRLMVTECNQHLDQAADMIGRDGVQWLDDCISAFKELIRLRSAPEPSAEHTELRWTSNDKIYSRPTSTDAIEYADQRLADPKEMDCCVTDVRSKGFENVRALLTRSSGEPSGEWQPIKTAPKKTWVLCGRSNAGSKFSAWWGWQYESNGLWIDANDMIREPHWWLPVPPLPLTKGEDHAK